MTALYRVAGSVLAVALIAGVVQISAFKIASQRTPDGLLRVAWSARPERVEKCRQRTPEELAQLPQHMREPVVCEGTTAEYRLQVRVGGTLAADRIVRGGGLRHDRRLYVLEELPVPPGDEVIDVRFDRVGDATPAGGSRSGARVEAAPPHLSFQQHVTFSPREVVLVTYAPDTRRLIGVARSGRP